MTKKKLLQYGMIVGGIVLLAAGLMLLKGMDAPGGFLGVLPYVCIGLGCGAFGHGVGDLVNSRVLKSDPQLQKQMEIEQKDERNRAIANRAKAKAFDAMLYLFGALLIAFALMMVELPAILLLVGAYLVVDGIFIYYLSKFHKEM